MTTLETLIVVTLGGAGVVSVCVLLILLAASIVQRDVEEFRFRKDLREAINEEPRVLAWEHKHEVRGHSWSHIEPVGRRGTR